MSNPEKTQDDNVAELQALLETERQARAAAETELVKRETDIAEINASGGETKRLLAETVNAYKALVVRSNPAIPPELISGDGFKAIDGSLEAARRLVARVRQAVEAELASEKIPAGAPPRPTPDLEGLSPREKIQYAVSKGGRV